LTEPRRQRRRAIFAIPAITAAVVAASLLAATPAAAHSPEPAGIDAFLRALGQVESGGNYYAVNSTTGAYGKYQIMPSNWPAWAEQYLGDRYAKPTPENQEIVAKGKVHDLHHWLGSWPVVAHWWLTGSSSKDQSTWSSYSKSYVSKVMTLYEQYGGAMLTTSTTTYTWSLWQESNAQLAYSSGWKRAYHDSYSGDYVRYNGTAGATVRFRAWGTGFQWIGPKGPTRGKAYVYVDGTRIATVDLYSSTFRPRQVVFQKSYSSAATRNVVIKVLGTAGRPVVALDAINVRREAK